MPDEIIFRNDCYLFNYFDKIIEKYCDCLNACFFKLSISVTIHVTNLK